MPVLEINCVNLTFPLPGGKPGSYFNGNRYIKDSDPGAMVLMDKNGYIAGIQAGVSTDLFKSRSIGHVNNIHTMQFFTGISRNTQSKSYVLSSPECTWEFQNNAL